MRGRIAPYSKIARRRHESLPEVLGPYPVHEDARGQGIPGTGDGARELEPAAAMLELPLGRIREDFEEAALHGFTRLEWIAAPEHYGSHLARPVAENDGVQRRGIVPDDPLLQVHLEFGQCDTVRV